MSEVADFLTPAFIAVDAVVVYFQSTAIFPNWQSIANKEDSVHGYRVLAITFTAFSFRVS
jgi:hypothetical protein